MISIKSNISAAIFLLISFSAWPALQVEGDWTLGKSPKAWVLTDTSPEVARRAIERFEIVEKFVAHELGIDVHEDSRELRPQYVLIPRSRDLFDKLAPFQSKHRVSRASGFYIQSDFNPLALIGGDSRSENWETVCHEFTHRILNAHFDDLPLWAEEGLAELFSTIKLRKTDAQLTRSRDRTQRYEASNSLFIDWDTFFATSRATLVNWIENHGEKAQAYYAQAALLAECTHFGDPKLKSGYWELVERSAYKPITELDCQILLGFEYSQLQDAIEKQLQNSFSRTITRTTAHSQPSRLFEGRENRPDPPKLESGELSQSPLPRNREEARDLEPVTNRSSPIMIRSASPSDVAAIVAISLSRSERARESQSLLEENDEQENPLWLAASSEVSIKLGNTAAALDYADQALQRSHPDPFLTTLSVMRYVNEERVNPVRALDSLTQAYRQGDSSRPLFNLYFEIARNASIPFDEFAPLAKQGVLIHPDIEYAQELNRIETERVFRN